MCGYAGYATRQRRARRGNRMENRYKLKVRCSNCIWYQTRWQQCLKTGAPTNRNCRCLDWRDINEDEL
jgi:hypothetical protein